MSKAKAFETIITKIQASLLRYYWKREFLLSHEDWGRPLKKKYERENIAVSAYKHRLFFTASF